MPNRRIRKQPTCQLVFSDGKLLIELNLRKTLSVKKTLAVIGGVMSVLWTVLNIILPYLPNQVNYFIRHWNP